MKPFLFLSLLLLNMNAFGQDQNSHEKPTDFWIGSGVGISAAGGGELTSFGGGLAARLSVSLKQGRGSITARATMNTGGESKYETVIIPGNLSDEFWDIGMLYGYSIKETEEITIILSGGLAAVGGSRVIKDDEPGWFSSGGKLDPVKSTIGVPVELSWVIPGYSCINTSFTLHANFNRLETFYGVTLNLGIGSLTK
ncbi:MAG: hypothetical protein H8E26_08125 [FCB group bacterium]|nr:hypothetical protein [FCB group bacterium]MBL7027813.1 hypothetical protein [Candidatus Neomarinimicrobiota bacterium]MBL7120894.1 hypothetical protein [Candidatus Neomarinimicrobiota bacterium]